MRRVLIRKKWVVATLVMCILLLGACGKKANTTTSHQESKVVKKSELPKNVKSSDWNLVLVNSDHKLKQELNFKQVTDGSIVINTKIESALNEFVAAASKAGYKASLVSGYRSISYQKEVYADSIQSYENSEKSVSEAEKLTKEYVAAPGSSEHHTGLAVDIMSSNWYAQHGDLDNSSEKDKGQKWLMDHAVDYGFILRFPKNKEKSTKIDYETWHFRYVGKDNAKYIVKHNLSLEEYITLLNKEDKK
ncbi:M15 family metallopeptidase [Dellaglioa carnosa]|uniref:M15 family metallopeptidase n=1 Tax=Dellaglioa carnosa TaxID=2995136 RepID=A0ABT4JMP1_9LACO|nr:M15 family metallopeptidase [Dellaglioa carnosa]MCZ2491611.1 M15 family metallopeptidase [Dellaglioa carnosa]MDK1731653.1 M15 family metallopeptidase [Dellaglioa carnosa]